MLVESAIGKYTITSAKDPENVVIASEKKETLISILDGVELVGGAHNENRSFSGEEIKSTKPFGRTQFQITITRTELLRYFEYEFLNFLDYPSLTQMRAL